MGFVTTKYESDNGQIHQIRLDSARAAVAGTPPTGAVTSSIKAQVSKGNSEFGLRPRGVTLARTLGTEPDTFTRTAFLPVLTPSDYASANFQLEVEITIGDITWKIIARRAEDY